MQTYYDAFNRAVSQNRNGAYTQIVYSPSGQKFGLMNGWYVQQYFVPLAAGMQAVYNGSGLQYYRHADWMGNSRFAATPTGSMYYDGAYAPFGENYAETGIADRSFTGQTQDTTPGLYDFLFRQQSSSQGRWLVPDPAGLAAVDLTNPQTWNRYAYVGNNPSVYIDPLGLYCAISPDGGTLRGYQQGAAGFWWGSGVFQAMTLPVSVPGETMQPASVASSIVYDPNQLGSANNSPQTIDISMVGLTYLAGTNTIGMFALGSNSAYLTPGGGIGGGGTGGALNKLWNYIKSHPVTISVNEIIAGQVTFQYSTGTICGNLGFGASVPPTKAVTVGVLNEGTMQNWKAVVSGPGYSFGANLFGGYQGMFNSSGKVGGPTVSGIGLSGSYTWGGCATVP